MSNQPSHKDRDHSKFSASGSERWLNCGASVALEEKYQKQFPNKNYDSFWSLEGTKAHEILEQFLLSNRWSEVYSKYEYDVSADDAMIEHCRRAASYIKKIAATLKAPLLVEKKVFNSFIHEEMFGTCDAIIPNYGKELHIIDFKYGQGHVVDPTENTQLIQYALGAAESYDWAFEKVICTIVQPRASSKIFKQWECSIDRLKNYWLPIWKSGVARIESGKAKPFVGQWCYWCKAKSICPEKIEKSFSEVSNAFSENPLPKERSANHGKEKSQKEKGRKEVRFEEIEETF